MGGAWPSCFGSLAAPAACVWLPHTAAPPPRPLPTRAPGKHPLSKVTAQDQPGAGVVVKALDRRGCRLWTDGWTDGRAGRLGGSFLGGGSRRPPCSLPGCSGHSLGPGAAPHPVLTVTRCRRASRTASRAVAWAPRPRHGGARRGARCPRGGPVGAGRP